MPLEDLTGTGKFISDLDVTSPAGGESKSDGDNHIAGIKNVIRNTFINITGQITATHLEINKVEGVTGGTALANKALVLGASRTIDYINVTTLAIGGTSLTVSAATLNAVSGTNTGDQTTITGNAGSATVLQTARAIGGVSFNGSANINLPGVNAAGNQSTSGNAATATVLATARTIGGVSFNGSSNINLPGVNAAGNQNTSGNAATATTASNITGQGALATLNSVGAGQIDANAATGDKINTTALADTSISVAALDFWYPPKGVYDFYETSTTPYLDLEVNFAGTWRTYGRLRNIASVGVFCDGTNVRVKNNYSVVALNCLYRRY